jgi:hypothetical protein
MTGTVGEVAVPTPEPGGDVPEVVAMLARE